MRLDRIGQLAEKGPGHPSDQWRDPDVEAPVLLRMDAHMVERLSGHRWCRAVDQPPAQLGVGGQPATDPQVEAGTVPGVHDADERDVVDLVYDVGQPADRGLELSRQIGELGRADVAALDLLDGPGWVEHLGGRDSGDGRAEYHARHVAA